MMSKKLIDTIQVVPPEMCFKCDVCCRFPEKDSFLAPYFMPDEISGAAAIIQDPSVFQIPPNPSAGCKITLIPYKEGYICPAFDPQTAHCRIYNSRPLDCMIYPFALMWDADGKAIVLGIDTKCPYWGTATGDGRGKIMAGAGEIASVIEAMPILDLLASSKGFIGPYQDDVIPLVALENLTSRF